MMMQCPRCSTRWRVAAAAPVENPLFKCGRCHHLFRQFPGATPPPESPVAPPSRKSQARAAEPDSLEFIFPDRQPAELLVADERPPAPPPTRSRAVAPAVDTTEVEAVEIVAPPPPIVVAHGADETTTFAEAGDEAVDEAVAAAVDEAPDESISVEGPLGSSDAIEAISHETDDESTDLEDVLADDIDEGEAEPQLFANDDELSERFEDDGDGPELFADEPESQAAAAALDDEGDDVELGDLDEEVDDEDDTDAVEPPSVDVGRRVRVEDVMKVPSGFGTIMRAMGTIVTGFAALALMIRVAPERMSGILAHVPVVGRTFAHDRNLASKVELTNVQGRFQRLRNARRVFVISGDARNNSGMTIERIEVAGALYGLGGGELDQKIVTTGNRTTLTDLSEAEIALLQRLDPALTLAPGETTPFLIVFLEPPRELREFSSRVLSVRPTRRASNPPAGPPQGSVG